MKNELEKYLEDYKVPSFNNNYISKRKKIFRWFGFFTNNSARYRFTIINIKQALLEKFDLKIEIESKDLSNMEVL